MPIGVYTRKPLEVSAVQWTGKNFPEIQEFAEGFVYWEGYRLAVKAFDIETMKKLKYIADIGDYLVKDENGFFFFMEEEPFKEMFVKASSGVEIWVRDGERKYPDGLYHNYFIQKPEGIVEHREWFDESLQKYVGEDYFIGKVVMNPTIMRRVTSKDCSKSDVLLGADVSGLEYAPLFLFSRQ